MRLNLRGRWYDLVYGVRNLVRWFPLVWRDRDWDWGYLAAVMAWKLRRMADLQVQHGHSVHADRYARQMRTCAALLQRMREDGYTENIMTPAVYHDTFGGSAVEFEPTDNPRLRRYRNRKADALGTQLKRWFDHAEYMATQDQRYLFHLMGKYLRYWWD